MPRSLARDTIVVNVAAAMVTLSGECARFDGHETDQGFSGQRTRAAAPRHYKPMRSSMRLAMTIAASLCLSGTAFAHAHLRTATPAVGSTVRAVPTEVSLSFTEGLEPRFSAIEVRDKDGARVDAGEAHLAQGDDKRFSVGLKTLAPGAYTVVWHATSVDTHKTEGSFQFTVAP